jgi:hypothetical protein
MKNIEKPSQNKEISEIRANYAYGNQSQRMFEGEVTNLLCYIIAMDPIVNFEFF